MRRQAAALALAGGALLMLGAVLDWSGVDYSSRLDRQITGACAAASAMSGVWLVLRSSLLAHALAVAAGLVAANMTVVNILDVSRHRHEYASFPEASVGLGLWLMIPGALLPVAAGVAGLIRRSPRQPAS